MLEAVRVEKSYAVRTQGRMKAFHAVKPTSFRIEEGASYALVGESGSGKTTLSQILMGLLPPTAGDILLDGASIAGKSARRDRNVAAQLQMVLQDGKSALDPRFTVYDSIAEPIRNLLKLPREKERELVVSLMQRMELSEKQLHSRAGELSGGQQKRVCIARAIAVSPRLIIFDEAVSGLDVIVRKHILDLLKALRRERPCAYLFVTHDMDVAMYMAETIHVMKEGEIVERVTCRGNQTLFTHPYSRLLVSSMA